MQTNPTQWADKVLDDVIVAWSEHGHSAGIEAIQAAFAEREARFVGALESANTLLTKAVGDIVAYRIMANKRPNPSATTEYVEAINAIDAILAALAPFTKGQP